MDTPINQARDTQSPSPSLNLISRLFFPIFLGISYFLFQNPQVLQGAAEELKIWTTSDRTIAVQTGKSTAGFESTYYVEVKDNTPTPGPFPIVFLSSTDFTNVRLELTEDLQGWRYGGSFTLTKGASQDGLGGADALLTATQEDTLIVASYSILISSFKLRNVATLDLTAKPWQIGASKPGLVFIATTTSKLLDDNGEIIPTASYTIEWVELPDGGDNGVFSTGTLYLGEVVSSATAGIATNGFQSTASGNAVIRATAMDANFSKISFASDTTDIKVIPVSPSYPAVIQSINLTDYPNAIGSQTEYILSCWIKTTSTLNGFANFGVTQFDTTGTLYDNFNFASATGREITHSFNSGIWQRYYFKFTAGAGPTVTANDLYGLNVELYMVGTGTVKFDGVMLEKLDKNSGKQQEGPSTFTLFKTLKSGNSEKDFSGKYRLSEW